LDILYFMTDFVYRKRHPEKRALGRKREKIRRSLRDMGILPDYKSTSVTPEQQYILDQISNNDFSYWEKLKGRKTLTVRKNKGVYENPPTKEEIIFYRAKTSARKRKLEFNLELSDVIVPTHCCYLGVELLFGEDDWREENYFSVDRIDSTKGYIKGNIQVISKMANTMKNAATQEQLISFAQNILKLYNS